MMGGMILNRIELPPSNRQPARRDALTQSEQARRSRHDPGQSDRRLPSLGIKTEVTEFNASCGTPSSNSRRS